jgi:hypothetical protein
LNVQLVHIPIVISHLIGILEVHKSILYYYRLDAFANPVHGYRYKYTLFLSVDGNYKLRLKDRGIADPELAPGWAYFVEEEKYQGFIKDYIDQPEVYLLVVLSSYIR